MTNSEKPTRAFIAMLALMTSMVALSIDVMLPAFPLISHEFTLTDEKDIHLIITALYFGFSVSQLVVGPLSDTYGRKPVIIGAFGLVIIGGVISIFAPTYEVVLLGRFIQGLGIAGPRILSITIVRDLYSGNDMARVVSVIMMVFICIPMVAPALGQTIMLFAGWRAVFGSVIVVAAISCTWYVLGQQETLDPAHKRAFSIRTITNGIVEVYQNRPALGYILANGFTLGPFLAYLALAQAIFQGIYGIGQLFPLYLAISAGVLGISSFMNARLVERLGMVALTRGAFICTLVTSIIFVAICFVMGGIPPLWTFMIFIMIIFFCIGLNFGNISALALSPLGHMAGTGTAVFGFTSTLLALPISWGIGRIYDGTITPLIFGFLISSGAALTVFEWARRARPAQGF